MRYTIGLDIGIASIGWAVINNDKSRIEDLGVRTFKKAENEKDGKALNLTRREARTTRRRLRRRAIRMQKIKDLFIKYNVISGQELQELYNIKKDDKDVWTLRKEGLDRKLDKFEWARVLTSIAKRRGYKSNRKTEGDKDAETGRLLKGTIENKKILEEKGYRTLGEMFALDSKFEFNKRNKGGEYNNTVLRNLLLDEIKKLFEEQRKLNNLNATKEFEEEYINVFEYQKPFMTPELLEKMIGKCTLEKEEKRASKNSYTFERFMLLQKINNFKLLTEDGQVFLNEEQRKKLLDLAYENVEIKYDKIRNVLDLPLETCFASLDYGIKGASELSKQELLKEVESKNKFVKLNGYHTLRALFGKYKRIDLWEEIIKDTNNLNKMADILTINKTDEDIINESLKQGFSKEVSEILINANFSKFGHLSYKAMKNIIPYLEKGLTYDKACEEAGYNFKGNKNNLNNKLPKLEDVGENTLLNPVVLRAITQTRKVINAIINKYGSPIAINIETSRDISKPFDERRKITKKQEENQKLNEETKNEIMEKKGIEAKAIDILKIKLWKEQQNRCAYSLEPIRYNDLFEDNMVQVEHIIPFSRCFDNSYMNKVLAFTSENQNKRERTPYEYFGSNVERWNKYETWVQNTYKFLTKKREKLLMKNFNDDKSKEFMERNLNDTRYIARFLKNYIENNLKFAESESKQKVYTINGQATAALRHFWGIKKDREESDKHHAKDAVIIGVSTPNNVKKVSNFSKFKKLYNKNVNGQYVDLETGEIVESKYCEKLSIKDPWPKFREELETRTSNNPSYGIKHGEFSNYSDVEVENIKPVFVSRMPERKITGQAHMETLRSSKFMKQGLSFTTVKKPLSSISEKEIKDIVSKEEFEVLYRSDKKLYDLVYERMEVNNFKADKAFGNDIKIYKPSNKGQGALVRSITIPVVTYSGVELPNKAIADNACMVRVDVFTKNGKFYLIPIYVVDLVKEKLPNKYISAHKPETEWKEVDESFEFIFSLHPNDLVKIKKKDQNEFYGYYGSTHRGTGAINLINHDNSIKIEGIGVQNLEIFEKYEVDVLGNYKKVKKEKRGGVK